jgi:endo-alpha-1,4-polygalactosaminidase (GH114 family)
MSIDLKKRHLKVILWVSMGILIILLILLSFELFRVLNNDDIQETEYLVNDSIDIYEFIQLPDSIKVPKQKAMFSPKSFAFVSNGYNLSTASKLRRFDVVGLEPYKVNEDFLKEVQGSGSLVLANLDIGKAQNWRHYWQTLDKNIIIKPDTLDDQFIVDVNNESWHNAIIYDEVPYVLALGDSDNDTSSYHGYDGLIIDNIGIIEEYPEMKTGVYKLIKAISQKYPGLLIVVNNGFDILPLVYPFTDGIMYEEMCYRYNHVADKYHPKDNINEKKVLINTLLKKKMPVLVLDHISTNPMNKAAALQCYDMVLTYNIQGFDFSWNANTVDDYLYLWDFIES